MFHEAIRQAEQHKRLVEPSCSYIGHPLPAPPWIHSLPGHQQMCVLQQLLDQRSSSA